MFGTPAAALSILAVASYFFRLVVGQGKQPTNGKIMNRFEHLWYCAIGLWPTALTMSCFVLVLAQPLTCWVGGDYSLGCDNVQVECIRDGPGEFLSDVAVLMSCATAIASTA